MNIPVSPIPVRISLETQAINNGGYAVHDIDVNSLIENANSAQYELQLCYGTASLYRSAVYHINKYGKTISFFFMVGTDLFVATLTTANNRCTFAKVSAGLSENEVVTLIQDEKVKGVAQGVTNVDEEGCTITMPFVDNSIRAAGHLLIFEEGSAYSTSNVIDTFIIHVPNDQWRYKNSSLGDFSFTPVTIDGVNTGITIKSTDAREFSAYVIWYENFDGCTIELGEYTPPSGG